MLTTFLVSVGVMCGISGVLAVMMVIADATIASYGEVVITINNEKKITAEGGRSLLSTLGDNKIFIPSACGGRGSCGLCKVKVLKGAGDILPTELPWLSKEERENNIRLSCQCKVKQDFEIEIPPELFSIREYQAEVEKIRDLTHDIKELTLKLLEPDQIEFTSGQFIQFQVPIYELTDESVYRAYSMASPSYVKDRIQLEIRYVPNGICTTYVFKHLKEKDKVTINGPYGDFFVRDTKREIIMIAGGSGMAPIRSILMGMAKEGNSRRARYFFGARSKQDLFLTEEMKKLEEELPGFKFIPALSQPLPEDNWDGETGLITDVVARHMETGDNTEAYLCGSPGMIDACIKVLTGKGVPEDLIYYDKFG